MPKTTGERKNIPIAFWLIKIKKQVWSSEHIMEHQFKPSIYCDFQEPRRRD